MAITYHKWRVYEWEIQQVALCQKIDDKLDNMVHAPNIKYLRESTFLRQPHSRLTDRHGTNPFPRPVTLLLEQPNPQITSKSRKVGIALPILLARIGAAMPNLPSIPLFVKVEGFSAEILRVEIAVRKRIVRQNLVVLQPVASVVLRRHQVGNAVPVRLMPLCGTSATLLAFFKVEFNISGFTVGTEFKSPSIGLVTAGREIKAGEGIAFGEFLLDAVAREDVEVGRDSRDEQACHRGEDG